MKDLLFICFPKKEDLLCIHITNPNNCLVSMKVLIAAKSAFHRQFQILEDIKFCEPIKLLFLLDLSSIVDIWLSHFSSCLHLSRNLLLSLLLS